MENSLVVPQKAKHGIIIFCPAPKHLPNIIKSRKSSIHNSQKVGPTQMFINRWIDIENVAYIYNKTLFSHKTEVLIHATTWMNVESFELLARHKRTDIVQFLFYETSRIDVKFIETENRLEVSMGWQQRKMRSYCLKIIEFLSKVMKIHGNREWRWLHNIVNMVTAIELNG